MEKETEKKGGQTGGRAGKLRASSTWSAEILAGRASSVVRNVLAKVASDMVSVLVAFGAEGV